MKKLFFIAILTILLNIVASAQNYNCWMHSGNDGLTHQCYSIIEMSDGREYNERIVKE